MCFSGLGWPSHAGVESRFGKLGASSSGFGDTSGGVSVPAVSDQPRPRRQDRVGRVTVGKTVLGSPVCVFLRAWRICHCLPMCWLRSWAYCLRPLQPGSLHAACVVVVAPTDFIDVACSEARLAKISAQVCVGIGGVLVLRVRVDPEGAGKFSVYRSVSDCLPLHRSWRSALFLVSVIVERSACMFRLLQPCPTGRSRVFCQ